MEDAKESGEKKSEGVKARVSNEQILEKLEEIITQVAVMQLDIDELKIRAGFRDTPLSMPEKQNYNTDPGPWVKKPQPPIVPKEPDTGNYHERN